MTDIYVTRDRSRRGCLMLVLLGLAAVIAAGWLLRGCAFKNNPQPPAGEAPPDVTADEVASPTPGPVNASVWVKRISEAEQGIDAGRLQDVRATIHSWLDQSPPPLSRQQLETMLGDINLQLILSPAPMAEKTDHVIKRGDTLGDLARKSGTTVELIKVSNQIERDIIRIGDRIRLFSGAFSVKVDKSDNILELFLNDRLFKRYQVGTGKYNRTPVGTYRITLRQERPTWYRPDGVEVPYGTPENLLGTHYLKLDTPGIGLHGTWEEETIGSQSSAGCVRLKNSDIEQLYTILPVGTPVEILD